MSNTEYNLSHLADLEDPSVIMMVGIPGSGKSYVAHQLSQLLDVAVLSSDECRKELSGDASDQSVSREAWEMVHRRAGDFIANGHSVIIDGTHNHEQNRRLDVIKYKKYGASAVVAVQIETSLETSSARNSSRERVVPDFVIARMQQNINSAPPSVEDGFDFVISVDNN